MCLTAPATTAAARFVRCTAKNRCAALLQRVSNAARCPIDELAASDKQMTPNKNHRGGVNANASCASGSFAQSRLTSIEPGRCPAIQKKQTRGRARASARKKLDTPPNAVDANQQHTLLKNAAAPAAAPELPKAKQLKQRPCGAARNCQVVHFRSPTAPDASPTLRRAADVS